jgi:hypothetical protein
LLFEDQSACFLWKKLSPMSEIIAYMYYTLLNTYKYDVQKKSTESHSQEFSSFLVINQSKRVLLLLHTKHQTFSRWIVNIFNYYFFE